jgi:hypothetical protein
MPSFGCDEYGSAEECRRRRAWEAHYRAKGCSVRKAAEVALRKCTRASTWPAKGNS